MVTWAQDAPVTRGTVVARICRITCNRQVRNTQAITTFSLIPVLSHGVEKRRGRVCTCRQACVGSSLVAGSWPPWPGVLLHVLSHKPVHC